MAGPSSWHASPRRDGAPHSDSTTGEVRVPLALFHIDEHQGDLDLVLSRVEGEELLDGLRTALTASVENTLRPGGVR
ncbi:hypothetical protein ACH437_30535 [Streptomyces xinghaiensis]|uniref:hypothetical protein n=1 Tax=Streptomyces xinghaiensis TaxID=1038928 RepID=UPI0037A0CD0C